MTNHQQYFWEQYVVNNQSEIVAKIIAARERNSLDQEWVAEKAGYSISQYIKFERGERKLEHEDIFRITTVIADYQDSLKPPLVRFLKKIDLQMNRYFNKLEFYVLDYLPATEALLNQISLRKIAGKMFFWLLMIVLLQLSAYNIGYFIGFWSRKIQTFAEALIF